MGIATLRPPRRFAVAALLFLVASPAFAQVQRSFLNPSFESPTLTAANAATGCYVQVDDASVPGWSTTHPNTVGSGTCTSPAAATGNLIELWRTNFNGVVARQGNNFAELNAAAASRMYQNACLINGEQINWRFSHRGRDSTTIRDVMDYNVGASLPIVRVGTTSNGAFNTVIVSQGTANAPASGGNGWVDYTGQFTYTGATGTNSLGFESISTANGNNSVGNFLDNIQIELRPFVEFVQPSSSTPESASSDIPTLRVNGTVFTAFNVTVQITGGTATLGTDYTTPGNSSTLTIAIPAGTYDGTSAGSLFALPVTVTQDSLVEGNETIVFQAQPSGTSPAPYLLASSTTCGGPVQTTWTYTIVDDDANISVTKNAAAPVAVAGQPTQFDIAYTVVVNNPTGVTANYGLVDTPGFDPDVSVVSASFTRNGGTATALAGSGPWTLQTQFRALAGGATDTYVVTVRVNIRRGSTTGNDTCATPSAAGSGLHNSATATLQATPANLNFNASACRNTPTPIWVTLRKQLASRAVATDQFQVRMRSGGNVVATATTSGSTVPASASTALTVLPAGNTLQFEEALKANGTGADQAPTNYASILSCTNATAGSPTVPPSGAGTTLATIRQWAEFTPAAGDDLDCTITNTAFAADLSITKTDGKTQYTPGTTSSYTIVVGNAGPSAASNAVFTDPAITNFAVAGVTCGSTIGGATCPTVANTTVALMQGTGIVIPSLPVGGSVTFTVTGTIGASATGNLTNVASIAPPAGQTDPVPGNNTATDTDTQNSQADLVIAKTNTPGVNGDVDQAADTVTAGNPTTYTIRVVNNGPSVATGAIVKDTAVSGLACPTGNVVSCAGAACPAGPITIANLQSGLTLGTLAVVAPNNAVTLVFSCNVP